MAAELAFVVAASSTGNVAVILNPDNPAQAYDVATNNGSWLTLDHTAAAQQAALAAPGTTWGSDERQVAAAPTNLPSGRTYTVLYFDSTDQPLGTNQVTIPGTINTPDDLVSAVSGNTYRLISQASPAVKLQRLDGDRTKTPYVVLQNATTIYSPGTNSLYTIASSDLDDLSDDIPDQMDAVEDGSANALAVYAGTAIGAALTTGVWDVIVLAGNNYLGAREAVLSAYWDGTNLTPLEGAIFEDTGSALPVSISGIVAGGAVLQFDIDDDFTFEMPSRKSGVLTAKSPIYLSSDSELPRFAFNTRPFSKAKPNEITSVEVLDSNGDASAGITVADEDDTSNCGVRDYLVISKVTAISAGAATYTVRITYTALDSSTFVVQGNVVVP